MATLSLACEDETPNRLHRSHREPCEVDTAGEIVRRGPRRLPCGARHRAEEPFPPRRIADFERRSFRSERTPTKPNDVLGWVRLREEPDGLRCSRNSWGSLDRRCVRGHDGEVRLRAGDGRAGPALDHDLHPAARGRRTRHLPLEASGVRNLIRDQFPRPSVAVVRNAEPRRRTRQGRRNGRGPSELADAAQSERFPSAWMIHPDSELIRLPIR